jgi:hypothetical protein
MDLGDVGDDLILARDLGLKRSSDAIFASFSSISRSRLP